MPALRERVGKGTISMPWRELTVIDQREEFVKLAMAPGANMSELCRRFGISRSNGHKWVGRYLTEGREGLARTRAKVEHSPVGRFSMDCELRRAVSMATTASPISSAASMAAR